jgi:DNA-binding GntR family transcriptional regulator
MGRNNHDAPDECETSCMIATVQPSQAATSGSQVDESGLLGRLRELVLSEEYGPGTALSEVKLADLFEVSRTPVREALKQLQVEGLVDIRPKVGTFVRQITRREIVEMFELKEVFEGMAARLMARRHPAEQLAVLERNIHESELALAAGNADGYPPLVYEFHETLLIGADNRKLLAHYRTLMNQLAYHRLVIKTVHQPGRLARSVAEHRRVATLISEKDGVGAEVAMRGHVENSAREVMIDLLAEPE